MCYHGNAHSLGKGLMTYAPKLRLLVASSFIREYSKIDLMITVNRLLVITT